MMSETSTKMKRYAVELAVEYADGQIDYVNAGVYTATDMDEAYEKAREQMLSSRKDIKDAHYWGVFLLGDDESVG